MEAMAMEGGNHAILLCLSSREKMNRSLSLSYFYQFPRSYHLLVNGHDFISSHLVECNGLDPVTPLTQL